MKHSDKSQAVSDQKTLTQTLLLLDGDLLLFRAAVAAETETNWYDDVWSLHTDLDQAKKGFQNMVEDICTELNSVNFIVCLSDRENFRHDVAGFYKSGRKKSRKPTGYAALVDWCMITYRTTKRPKLEADDVMGIISTMPTNEDCIIVSDDKDMKTIPGRLYRPQKREHLVVSEEEADRFFYTQCLTGDITDGYKGLEGIGEKRAATILGSRPCWELVEAAYVKAGKTAADALQQARLARILRCTDWNKEKQEVVLWTPPGRNSDERELRADDAEAVEGERASGRSDD